MYLRDCELDSVAGFLASPFERNSPEKKWVDAGYSGEIPLELYTLYCTAGFLSFGAGSKFLTDDDNVLFSYFSIMVDCLADSLIDAKGQLENFLRNQDLTYDAGKKFRGESWDPGADARARRHLRDLLIALDSSLDTIADIVAIFLTGQIDRLRLGRGDFLTIERWVAQPLKLACTPYDSHLQKLYDALKPLILPGPPEEDWLPLMHTLRNKSVHLGQMTLRQMGLPDKNGKYYVFLPRKWPLLWEKNMKPHDPAVKPAHMSSLLGDLLINQDMMSFAVGLHKKVVKVVEAAVREVLNMYQDFANFDTNKAAIAELDGYPAYKFENFI
jgi:hypothetical protein